ncbi:MAG: PEF-CTERM sorting domain-containing protein [Euryarchaeota archaeon]|nr:PEF-CTERM sorting domain-containing protein [Euryarchaeota archaeon]
MKLKYIIGILALLLLIVGTASAKTVVPVDIYKDDPYEVPENVEIKAIFDGNTVSVEAKPTNGAASLPTDFDIQGIYLRVNYKEGDDAVNNDPKLQEKNLVEVWGHIDKGKVSPNFFGDFSPVSAWEGSTRNEYKSGGPIVITHEGLESEIKKIDGYSIVLKVSWGGDKSNYVGGSRGSSNGGSSNGGSSNIPEFPTIALPIAAILGLMFIFGRRKQK